MATAMNKGSILRTNDYLALGQYLTSANGQFTAILQEDGNFVIYGPNRSYHWDTKTAGKNVVKAVMQDDGNFVLYDVNNNSPWNSFDHGQRGDGGNLALTMQDSGQITISPINFIAP